MAALVFFIKSGGKVIIAHVRIGARLAGHRNSSRNCKVQPVNRSTGGSIGMTGKEPIARRSAIWKEKLSAIARTTDRESVGDMRRLRMSAPGEAGFLPGRFRLEFVVKISIVLVFFVGLASSQATAAINIDSILSVIACDTTMQRAFFKGEAKPEFMVCSVMSGRNCHASFLDELIRLKRPEYPHLTDDSLARVIMNEGRGIAADTTTVLDADVSRYQSGDWVVKVYEYAEGIVMARVDPFFENADNCKPRGWLGFWTSAEFMFLLDKSGNVEQYYLALLAD